MDDKITKEKLEKYLTLTSTAIEKAMVAKEKINIQNARHEILDMAIRYVKDAKHFQEKGDFVNAFAALNYAHGWLDAGARLGFFDVHDSKYFAVD